MDWFRWHHGSVTDPKFQLVAKKAGARPSDVISVWACLLEEASQSEDRGNPGSIDFESIDCLLGLDDGAARRIYDRMNERGLFSEDGRVEAWERRQPKREREDDTAAERKRRQRSNETTQSGTPAVTPSHAKSRQTEPSDDTSHQKTPRGEESREDERGIPSEAKASGGKPPKLTDPKEIIFGYGLALLTNAGTTEKQARSFLGGLEKAHGPDALIDKLRECAKAKPLQPLEWLAAALPPPKKGDRPADKSPPWCRSAGFLNVYEANNAGCYEHTAEMFRDGRRIEEPA